MIHNTHYNLIDTLIFAFGLERWNEICKMVMPAVRERIGADSILIPFKYSHGESWKQFKDLSQQAIHLVCDETESILEKNNPESEFLSFQIQVRRTIIECVLFALTEGYISPKMKYGMPE
jgi:hypothetical protein